MTTTQDPPTSMPQGLMSTDQSLAEAVVLQRHQAKLAQALISSGGDLTLVTERLNMRRAEGTPEVSQVEVLDAFLTQAAASAETQGSIKALMLLNMLEILNEAKSHLMTALPDFSPAELLRTIQLVIEGIAKILPEPVAAPSTNVNLFQSFGADNARDRLEGKLAQIHTNIIEMESESPDTEVLA